MWCPERQQQLQEEVCKNDIQEDKCNRTLCFNRQHPLSAGDAGGGVVLPVNAPNNKMVRRKS